MGGMARHREAGELSRGGQSCAIASAGPGLPVGARARCNLLRLHGYKLMKASAQSLRRVEASSWMLAIALVNVTTLLNGAYA